MNWKDKVKAARQQIEEAVTSGRTPATIRTTLYSDLHLVLTSDEVIDLYHKYDIAVHSDGRNIDVVIRNKHYYR